MFASDAARVRRRVRELQHEWMSSLVEFPLEGGGSLLVQTDDAPGSVTRGFGRDPQVTVETADKTFEQATALVVPAARSLISRKRR